MVFTQSRGFVVRESFDLQRRSLRCRVLVGRAADKEAAKGSCRRDRRKSKQTVLPGNRVIVEIPVPPAGTKENKHIDDIIKEVQKKRDTPDTGTRDDLEELWFIKRDGTILKVFPNGGVK